MPRKSTIINQVDNSCEVLLYGLIGRWWEIDTTRLIVELEECRKQGITNFIFHVNSEGGEVAQIQALWNYLNRDDITVTWIIDGMAASSAYLAMTNTKHRILCCRYSKILIHRVSGALQGNADEMRSQADSMELFEKDCIQMIADRCGKTVDQVRSLWFDGVDHWFSPEQAIANKLCDGYSDDIEGMEEPPESLVNPTDIYNFFQSRITNLILSNTMDHKEIAPIIGLDVNSPEAAVKTGIQNVVNRSKDLEQENATLKADKSTLEGQVKAMNEAKVKALVDAAISSKKITEDQRQDFMDMAQSDLERTQRILDKMPAVGRLTNQLGGGSDLVPDAEKNFTWDDYHKKGTLENLKATNFERFKALYKTRFNRDYENQ